MSSSSGGRGKRIPYDPQVAAKERKAAYMRDYRSRRDVRERPEARVLDRALTAALALVLAGIDQRQAVQIRRAVLYRAVDGCLREGYGKNVALEALLDRLDDLADGSTSSSVRAAFEAKRWGQSVRGGRVRHEDALTTPNRSTPPLVPDTA